MCDPKANGKLECKRFEERWSWKKEKPHPCRANDGATSMYDPGHRGPFSFHNVLTTVDEALVTFFDEVNLVTKVKAHSRKKRQHVRASCNPKHCKLIHILFPSCSSDPTWQLLWPQRSSPASPHHLWRRQCHAPHLQPLHLSWAWQTWHEKQAWQIWQRWQGWWWPWFSTQRNYFVCSKHFLVGQLLPRHRATWLPKRDSPLKCENLKSLTTIVIITWQSKLCEFVIELIWLGDQLNGHKYWTNNTDNTESIIYHSITRVKLMCHSFVTVTFFKHGISIVPQQLQSPSVRVSWSFESVFRNVREVEQLERCLTQVSADMRSERPWLPVKVVTYVTPRNHLRQTFFHVCDAEKAETNFLLLCCSPGCFGYGASSDERPMKSYKLISTTIFIVLLPDPRFRSRCSWNPVDGRKNFQNCQRCNAIFCTLQYSSLIKLDLFQCKI